MAADVFAALSNPVRRELLDQIRLQPRPVKELASSFQLKRPAISEHLKVLRDAGLVREEQRGRENYYYLLPEPLREVQGWLEPYQQFWRQRFEDLRAVLESEEGRPS